MYKLGFFTILLLVCAANDNNAADNIQGNSVPLANVNIKSVAAKGVFFGLMNLSFNRFHFPMLMPGNISLPMTVPIDFSGFVGHFMLS
ncbi:hypothetical protein ACKWTF_011889 [Chironomus riparius]